jgi:hypothetical protein
MSADKPPRPPADSDARKRPGAAGAEAKRRWTAPRIRTGHLFESNSLACGKSTPAREECIQNPVMS